MEADRQFRTLFHIVSDADIGGSPVAPVLGSDETEDFTNQVGSDETEDSETPLIGFTHPAN